MKKIIDKNPEDAELRRMFHERLPEAPVTAWFTRKVMNRLPPVRRRVLSNIEWGTYGVAVLILIGYWVLWLSRVFAKGMVTVSDLREMTFLVVLSLVPVVAVIAPKIVNWLRE